MSSNTFSLQAFEGEYANKKDNIFEGGNSLVRCHPGKCLLPPYYAEIAQKILNAPVRKDDMWLISFPRTGSTWCQEMVWLLGNGLNFEKAKTTLQQVRAPLIESPVVLFEYEEQLSDQYANSEEYVGNLPIPRFIRCHLPFDLLPDQLEKAKLNVSRLFTDSVGFVEDSPSPRFIKSHLPIELLPRQLMTVKPKIIYTMRNPKDLCVSYFYHCQMVHKMNIEFENFCELFLNDALPIGSVFNHYLGFWNRRHEPNILILRYEDMKSDTRATVKKIAQFMEKSLNEEEADAICDFLSFQNMRENKACNLQVLVDAKQGEDYYKKSGKHFIRKGIVGDYKNHMTLEMTARFDKWIAENIKGTDLTF